MTLLNTQRESWPLAKPFTISRGTKTVAEVVVVELITDDGLKGCAECVPYPHYNETPNTVMDHIGEQSHSIANGMTRQELQETMPSGAARNALDCAFWDLEAKRSGQRVWNLASIPYCDAPYTTSVTIGIDTLDNMAKAARKLARAPLLKIKLGTKNVVTCIATIRENAPTPRLIIDPNEGWSMSILQDVAKPLADLGVDMIEQPLPKNNDEDLLNFNSPIPICADESCHTANDLAALKGKYDFINIKLDKTGGLTEALSLARIATNQNFRIMIGCMVGTSLSIAPAVLLGAYAEFVDLDGPILLNQDRDNGLNFNNGKVSLPDRELWG